MRKTLVVAVLLVSAGAAAYAYRTYIKKTAPPESTTATTSQGDIIEVVSSTGPVQPTRTIEIGTQVSGIVQKLYVDFNSMVKKGQVVATLDPLLSQAAVDQAQASYDESGITLQQAKNQLATDQRNADRAVELFAAGLDTAADRDTAQLTAKQDQVAVTQDEAAVAAAKAGLEQAKVNLDYCTISSPADGVVISRDVDEGQTVAARMSVPALYELGTDLTKLQITAAVDEADVSKVRAGQDVTFTVEAYPTKFHGTVAAIHLDATTTNNVVTYQTVIAVDNPDLRLRPGMTATISIQTARASNVVRVPVAALKFHPTAAIFAALNEPMPPPISLAAATECDAANPCVANVSTTGTAGAGANVQLSSYKSVNGAIDSEFASPPHPATASYVWTLTDGRLDRVPIRVGISRRHLVRTRERRRQERRGPADRDDPARAERAGRQSADAGRPRRAVRRPRRRPRRPLLVSCVRQVGTQLPERARLAGATPENAECI